MKSKIANSIKLKNQPVAVFRSDTKPEEAMRFQEGKRGCVISMLNAAAKGRIAVFDEKTTAFKPMQINTGKILKGVCTFWR